MSQPESRRRVAVRCLVSSGRHPISGRPGRAREDARAVEMGLRLAGCELGLVHAGDAQDPALREYLGMFHGVERATNSAGVSGPPEHGELTLLPMLADDDAVAVLATLLAAVNVDIVLTGQRAECGEGSGLLPYLLAARLGWAVVTSIAAVESIDGNQATLLQALPQGQRRRLTVTLPCVIAVDAAAPAPRQSAFGPARRGAIQIVGDAETVLDSPRARWQWQPSRARPKRLKVVKSTNARDRFKAAAAKSSSSGGQVLTDLTPDQAADKLIEYLRRERILSQPSGE